GAEQRGEGERPDRAGLELAAGEGAAGGARHLPVALALVVVVERARGAGGAEDGKGKRSDLPGRRRLAACGGETGQGARCDGDADPELQQGDDDLGRSEHRTSPIDSYSAALSASARVPTGTSS